MRVTGAVGLLYWYFSRSNVALALRRSVAACAVTANVVLLNTALSAAPWRAAEAPRATLETEFPAVSRPRSEL